MKTKLLITSIVVFLSYFSFAQCLVLHHEGEQIEPNAVITVEGNASEYETIVELDVENTCGNDLDVLVRRYEETMVPETSSAFCWLVCFLPNVSLSPYPLTIAANSILTNNFSGHYYPDGNEGVSTISYVFFDQNNPNDSVMVTVNYDCILLDVAENNLNIENAVKIYPVPAQNDITIELNSMYNEVDLQIMDITGSMVKEIKHVKNGSSVMINDLANGLYLYRTFSDGNLLKTGRLVIRR